MILPIHTIIVILIFYMMKLTETNHTSSTTTESFPQLTETNHISSTTIESVTVNETIQTVTNTITTKSAESVPVNETHQDFDFRKVVKENSKYVPFKDKCPLRIYGGEAVRISQVPYQAIIRMSDQQGYVWRLVCGGAIITPLYVVSAAHCYPVRTVQARHLLRVVAGADLSSVFVYGKRSEKQLLEDRRHSKETWRVIEHFYFHAHFSLRYVINHDFAVLQLHKNLIFTPNVQPIPMLRNSLGIQLVENAKCLVSGYGLKEHMQPSASLRMVCVPLVLTSACKKYFGVNSVTRTQFCAGSIGMDTCLGDSGGPITYKGYLVGLVSYGGVCGAGPGVYTLISSYTTGEEVPFTEMADVASYNYVSYYIFVLWIFLIQ